MNTKKIKGFALSLCIFTSIFTQSFIGTSFAATQPDLTIEKAGITSISGTSIKYSYTIKNNGSATISNLYNVVIQAYLSANTIFGDAGDSAAGGTKILKNLSLAPGESRTFSYSAFGKASSKQKYLVIKIDNLNSISESNENNNAYAMEIPEGTTKMVSLRPEVEARGISIRNQNPRGTCVSEAMTFLQEYMLSGAYGSKYNHISIDYAVQASNITTGNKTDDLCFKSFNTGYNTYGAVPDSLWPYDRYYVYNYDTSNKKFNTLKSTGATLLKDGYRLAGKCIREGGDGAVTDGDLNTVMAYLDRGIPVAQAHNGHATGIVGYEINQNYDGGGRFLYRNSWGDSGANRGYEYFTFNELKNSNLALFVYEIAASFPKIYKDINYTGYNVALAPGKYVLSQLENIGVLNDDISSISVPSGYTVYLYEHNGFGGVCKTFTSSNANFVDIGFNDKVSSIEVIKN